LLQFSSFQPQCFRKPLHRNGTTKGSILKADKKSNEALVAFKEAVKLKSDYKEAWYEMGWCQNDTKDYGGAIASLTKARSLWPGIYKVYFELGYAFEKINSIDSAISNYNQCLQITTTNAGVYRQLGTFFTTKTTMKLHLIIFRNMKNLPRVPSLITYIGFVKGLCKMQ
jgi:tetratricopeptide (TPR) repeat protein